MTFKYVCLAAVSVLMAGCTLETSGNGALDGYWHLEQVDTLSTGRSADMSGSRIFWSFSVRLMNVSDRDGKHGDFLLRFENDGNTLRTYDPHKNDRPNGDPAVDDVEALKPFGINAMEDTFRVERLKGAKMVLSTKKLRLSFTKF